MNQINTTTTANTLPTARQLELVAQIPQVLLDYIWDLVHIFPHKKREQAMLFLRPTELGGQPLQEVRVCCGEREERRRVFGFPPVNADILVDYNRNGCVMQLVCWRGDDA